MLKIASQIGQSRMQMSLRIILITTLWSCLLLAGCRSEEILHNVDESQSIDAAVALGKAGIASKRSSSGKAGQYSLAVESSQALQALEVLKKFGFPKKPNDELLTLTATDGFVPTSPKLAELRYLRGLGAEAERILRAKEGVIDATVVVSFRLAAEELDLSVSSRPLSAAVVVKMLKPRTMSASDSPTSEVALITSLVSHALPNLPADQVQVSVETVETDHEAATVFARLEPFFFEVRQSQKQNAQIQVVLILLIVAVAALVVGTWTGFRVGGTRARKSLLKLQSSLKNDSKLIEGSDSTSEGER
ncbi:hypothetical protein JNK13_02245 [bacterium]|nr:hypothetical protein [bacterium]